MFAITVDSAGNRTNNFGLPPLPGPGQPERDAQLAAVYREVQRRDPPSQTAADPHAQARAFTNGVYVAVKTVMTALGGASIVVSVRTPKPVAQPADPLTAQDPQAKSLTASATAESESEWSPAPPDHPLARLFRHINPLDTVTDYLAERSMCESLFGETVEWVIPTEDGTAPAELWNLRRNYLTSLPLSLNYPSGGWRYSMPRPMMWSASSGYVLIPREQTLHHRSPNPLFPWSGYSPIQAGGKFVDFLNSVIDSRQQSMDHGFTPDMLVQMSGATEHQMSAFLAYVRTFATGQNRGQRFLPVDGDKVNVVPVNTPPDKMMYPQGYDQGTAAVLALFGVPPSVAGLTESGSYSSFYAAARQFRETTLNHQVKRWGEFWTKHLANPFFGDDVQVEVKLPALQDPDLKDRQVGTILGANGMSINRLLAIYDMPPVEWGEVTPAEYQLQLQQKYTPQPQPQPGMEGMEGMEGGGEMPPDDPNDPDGGQGGFPGVSGDDPQAPGDDPEGERPDVGAVSAGSLPPSLRKGMRRVRKSDDEARDASGKWTSGGGHSHASFHAAIRDAHKTRDRLPSLVYADHLEENGHPASAAFIRQADHVIATDSHARRWEFGETISRGTPDEVSASHFEPGVPRVFRHPFDPHGLRLAIPGPLDEVGGLLAVRYALTDLSPERRHRVLSELEADGVTQAGAMRQGMEESYPHLAGTGRKAFRPAPDKDYFDRMIEEVCGVGPLHKSHPHDVDDEARDSSGRWTSGGGGGRGSKKPTKKKPTPIASHAHFEEEAGMVSRLREPAKYNRLITRADANQFGMMPRRGELVALAQVGRSVQGSYKDAGLMMGQMLTKNPHDAIRWVTLNAILSAQTGWIDHTRWATAALATWDAADRPTTEKELDDLFGVVLRLDSKGNPVDPDGPMKGTPVLDKSKPREFAMIQQYNGSKAEAIKRILRQGDEFEFGYRQVSDGSNKTPNFAYSFLDARGAPIDTHMAKLLGPWTERMIHDYVQAGGPKGGADTLLDIQKTVIESTGTFMAYKTLIGLAAAELGWEPREVQECVWTGVLAVQTAKHLGSGDNAHDIMGNLNAGAVRAGWDLETVLDIPEMRDALRTLGAGGRKVASAVRSSRRRRPLPSKDDAVFTEFPGHLETAAARLRPQVPPAAEPIRDRLRDPSLIRKKSLRDLARRNLARLLKNLKDEEGHEHASDGRFTGPGDHGGHAQPAKPPEPVMTRKRLLVQQVQQAATTIRHTNDPIRGEEISRRDLDDIENAMTRDERDAMEMHLDEARDNYVDGYMQDWEPPDDLTGGWNDKKLRNELKDLLGSMPETDDGVTADDLEPVIQKWYEDTYNKGNEALDEALEALRDAGATDEQIAHFADLSEEIDRDIEKEREQAEEDARETAYEQYDEWYDKREYLRDFYDEHDPDGRWDGEVTEENVWGGRPGAKEFVFTTTGGLQFFIADDEGSMVNGIPLRSITFTDAAGSYGRTGKAGIDQSGEVFHTVAAATAAAITHNDYGLVTFTAADVRRANLYVTLVQTVARAVPGYAAMAVDSGGGSAFLVVKHAHKQDARDYIKRVHGVEPRELVKAFTGRRRGPTV